MKNKKLLGFICLTVLLVLCVSSVNFKSVKAAVTTRIFIYDPKWEGNVSTAADTSLTAAASIDATRIYVASTLGFDVGDSIRIGEVAQDTTEVNQITDVVSNYFDLSTPLQKNHAIGERVRIETFTIEIKIADVTELVGWQFSLQWDTSILELVGVAEGPFLNRTGSYPSDFSPVRKPGDPGWNYDDTLYVADSLISPTRDMAAKGSGVLATVTFRVRAEGTTTLRFRRDDPAYPSPYESLLVGWAQPGMGFPPEIKHTVEDGHFIFPGPKIFVDPLEVLRPDLPIGTGSFDVNISIANVNNLYNWSLSLGWSPQILDYIGIEEGPFLKDVGTASFTSSLNQAAGYLNISNTLVGGPLGGVNGSGTLATVTFLVEAKGTSDLDIYNSKLFKSDGTVILHVTADGFFSNEKHDVAITNVDVAPTSVRVGESVNITVTAKNEGEVKESFDVTVYYDNRTIGSSSVSALPPNNSTDLRFNWGTKSVDPGTYTIKAKASRVPGEVNLDNNEKSAASQVTVSGGTFEIPLPLIIGGVAVAAVGGVSGFFFYRRRSKSVAKSSGSDKP